MKDRSIGGKYVLDSIQKKSLQHADHKFWKFGEFNKRHKKIDNIDNKRRADIYEKNGKIFYELELPGIDKKEVEIKIEKNKLIISMNQKETEEEKDRNYIRKTRRQKNFKKSYPIPKTVKKEGIKAEFKKGVLRIEAPFEKEKSEEGTINVHID